MLEKTERTVAELSSLLRMLMVLSEADNVEKIYPMLLALCTTWRTFGFQRAYLLLIDPKQRLVRGHLAAESVPYAGAGNTKWKSTETFEALAKNVFKNYEQIESSDLTLKTKAFSVPLDWYRSAVVKAISTEFPVLAEGRLSEFATDPFLDFFGTNSYIAMPLKVHGRVTAVVAAENGITDQKITVEDISLIFSLVQIAVQTVERMLEEMDRKRKDRVQRKLQEIFKNVDKQEQFRDTLNLVLSMICRASGGSGIFLKDLVSQKTTHLKTVDEFTVEANDTDLSIGECFEMVLDRTAGTLQPISGDSKNPLLNDVTAETIRCFYACPLTVHDEIYGAVAVYVEKNQSNRKQEHLEAKDTTFIELCSEYIAVKLHHIRMSRRIERNENIIEEVRANLNRERDMAKMGMRAMNHYQDLIHDVEELKTTVMSRGTYQKRIETAKEKLRGMESELTLRRRELASMKFSLQMTDLFGIVKQVVTTWKEKAEKAGIEVTLRIPSRGPLLLMNKKKINLAFENILQTMTSCVKEGDKVLVECSTDDENAMVVIADTGNGLPGNLLSRLFMPFSNVDQDDEFKSAMSLAGDILHSHAGEITIKSSTSWKTILVTSFPFVANKDRRNSRVDRRRTNERRKAKRKPPDK